MGFSATMLLFMCLLAAPFFVAGQFEGYTGPCGEGRSAVRIGDLPTLDHNVSGVLWIEHQGRFCIENFYYDGQGPDAFIYFFYPGDEVRNNGGGYTIALNAMRAQFAENVAYLGETFRFALPERTPVGCDFGNITIWCRYASALFTKLEIPSSIFSNVTVDRQTIACSPSPGRAFMGVLPTLFHDVSGDLYVKDNKTIVIRNFNYDGFGPDAFVYWYSVGAVADELGNGNIIPVADDREGAFPVGAGANFVNEPEYVITIPDDLDVYTCDIGTFTIWCRRFTQFFTKLEFNTALFTNSLRVKDYEPSHIYCDRPSTRPGIYVGELPTSVAANDVSGSLYVVDEYKLYIQLFNFRPEECTAAYLYFYSEGQTVQNNGGGYTISLTQTQETLPKFYVNENIEVDLRFASVNARTCDIKYFTVWCQNTQMHLTSIEVPANFFTDNIQEVTQGSNIFCEQRLTAGATPVATTVTYFFASLIALVAYIFKP